MSDWIEENGLHTREGYGVAFIIHHVHAAWRIKTSPYLLDIYKPFPTLTDAKTYCDERWTEINGRREEIASLRAELAAVTAERDRMRQALKPLIEIENYPDRVLMRRIDRARAALEGVTEPASPWRDIESAPKDGAKILVAEYCDGGKYPEDARWDFWVDSWRKYASGLGEGFGLPKRPTVWMPLPEPPR